MKGVTYISRAGAHVNHDNVTILAPVRWLQDAADSIPVFVGAAVDMELANEVLGREVGMRSGRHGKVRQAKKIVGGVSG
jgi:hypothetical protein